MFPHEVESNSVVAVPRTRLYAPLLSSTGPNFHCMAHTHRILTITDLPAAPTIKDSAAYAGVHPKTIRNWIAAGRLRAYRVGPRAIRVDRQSLVALATDHPVGGAA